MAHIQIEKLRPEDLNCNIFSTYDYDGLSLQELLCQFFHKINECIDVTDNTIKLADWLVNEGLAQEVAKQLVKWKEDGTLEDIIDVAILGGLKLKLKNIMTLEELGAKGDGVADDLPAFKKAEMLLNSGKVVKVIGYGTYAISDTVQIAAKNEVEYDLGTVIPHDTFNNGRWMFKAGNDSGSQANVRFKAVLIDGKNKAKGLQVTSCGSSTFDVGTFVNCFTAIESDNPTQISSDNKFKGNNIRQCGFGIVLRSEQKSALEGTMIDYNFIYDNKYAGILLGKGSHYADIRTMTDFNGKHSILIDFDNDVEGTFTRGGKLIYSGETLTAVEVFKNQVYAISPDTVLANDNTKFKPGVSVNGQRIKSITTNDTDPHIQRYLDIVNANTLAGFSKNTIVSTYCGGIVGNRMSIATDFILTSRTGQNERNNLNGLSTWVNNVEVVVSDFLNNKKIFGYNHDNNRLDLAGNGIYSSEQGFEIEGTFDHKVVAHLDQLSSGNYIVTVFNTTLNEQYSWSGVLAWNREKNQGHLEKTMEHNILANLNGREFQISIRNPIPKSAIFTKFLKIG